MAGEFSSKEIIDIKDNGKMGKKKGLELSIKGKIKYMRDSSSIIWVWRHMRVSHILKQFNRSNNKPKNSKMIDLLDYNQFIFF